MIKMTRGEMYDRLETAQALLSDVYDFACANKLDELERLMSMADTMIAEAYEEVECGDTANALMESK